MPNSDAMLTLHEAAAVVGCHYQTLYRRVRSGELPAMVVGGTYRIQRTDLDSWLNGRDVRRGAVPHRTTRNWSQLSATLIDTLLDGDTKTARQQADRLLDNGVTVTELCDHLYGPTLTRVGELWLAGEITVAQEHRASRIVEGLLDRATARAGKSGPRVGCVVVAAPVGDRHALAPQMVAAGLHAEGFRVNYLGADLPVEEIVQFAKREVADFVALSCSVADHTGLSKALSALSAEGIPTLIGGSGIGSREALALGATRYGATIADAQLIARELMRTPSSN